jgi:hypothetical protein
MQRDRGERIRLHARIGMLRNKFHACAGIGVSACAHPAPSALTGIRISSLAEKEKVAGPMAISVPVALSRILAGKVVPHILGFTPGVLE